MSVIDVTTACCRCCCCLLDSAATTGTKFCCCCCFCCHAATATSAVVAGVLAYSCGQADGGTEQRRGLRGSEAEVEKDRGTRVGVRELLCSCLTAIQRGPTQSGHSQTILRSNQTGRCYSLQGRQKERELGELDFCVCGFIITKGSSRLLKWILLDSLVSVKKSREIGELGWEVFHGYVGLLLDAIKRMREGD